MFCFGIGFDAIATSDGIADELYLSLGKGSGWRELFPVLDEETMKLGHVLVAFADVCDNGLMGACWQISCKGHDGIAEEGYLERLASVNFCHEVAAVEFAHHVECGACEACAYLHTRISEYNALGVGVLNAPDVLDIGVIGMKQCHVGAFPLRGFLLLRVSTLGGEK